jgi:TRAP-type C4-dicarboxylate transport system permease small subunit
MQALNKIKHIVDKVMEICCVVILGIMTILVCYQVITRYVFHNPSAISEILSQYLFVWMLLFGSAYVFGSREHLTIDILKDKFSPKVYMIVEVITYICLFVFTLGVCVYGGFAVAKTQMMQIDASLHIPIGVIYASIPFTGVITLFYAVFNTFRAVDEYNKGVKRLGDDTAGTM